MFVNNGHLLWTLNTSTGGGYTYTSGGVTSVAITPTGLFHTYRVVDGLDISPLGQLWRPRYFTGGYAIHGDSAVPPYAGVPRVRPGQQRGHRLDLGQQPRPDRDRRLGVLSEAPARPLGVHLAPLHRGDGPRVSAHSRPPGDHPLGMFANLVLTYHNDVLDGRRRRPAAADLRNVCRVTPARCALSALSAVPRRLSRHVGPGGERRTIRAITMRSTSSVGSTPTSCRPPNSAP